MLLFLKGPILGTLAMLIWCVNTLFWCFYFYVVALFKLLIPIKYFRVGCTSLLDDIASLWMASNSYMLRTLIGIKWDVIGDVNLSMDKWYLVISNHQSWTDIVALMEVLNRKIPLLKFFLKKELLFVPVLGFTWWALDYPFMRRYSKAMLKKKPHLKGKDLETTQKACERFKKSPISVMNFVEGTRCTPEKYAKQSSNFKHLLAPKAGGIAYTLQAMGKQLSEMIDVTIIYPEGKSSLWQLFSGKISRIKVHIRTIAITDDLIGDYQNDKQFRIHFQKWLNDVWHEKDALLMKELSSHG